jgi:hypothetical protein
VRDWRCKRDISSAAPPYHDEAELLLPGLVQIISDLVFALLASV